MGELSNRLKAAGETPADQEAATCCYAKSNKSWVSDPSGLRWETFFTFGEATSYGEDLAPASPPVQASAPRPVLRLMASRPERAASLR